MCVRVVHDEKDGGGSLLVYSEGWKLSERDFGSRVRNGICFAVPDREVAGVWSSLP